MSEAWADLYLSKQYFRFKETPEMIAKARVLAEIFATRIAAPDAKISNGFIWPRKTVLTDRESELLSYLAVGLLTCLSPPCGVCMEHQCKTGLPGLHEILVTAGSCFKQPCVLKRVGGTRIDRAIDIRAYCPLQTGAASSRRNFGLRWPPQSSTSSLPAK